MRNTLKLVFLFLLFINCKGLKTVNINSYNQENNDNKYFKDINNNYQNFVGTWENTTGNITFRVIVWKVTRSKLYSDVNSYMDKINGRFLIIQDAGTNNEVVLCNSIKYFPQNGVTSNNVITGYSINNMGFGGYFVDTCASNGTKVIEGMMDMTITNLGSSPFIAHWIVETRPLDSDETLSIPTDIMLTKVN